MQDSSTFSLLSSVTTIDQPVRRKGCKSRVDDRSLPVMIVDLVLAIARGTAELPSFAALFRVRLADPVTKRPDQFGAVRPKIVVVAGVRAQLVVRTVVLAHAARLARHVRTAKLTFVIAATSRKNREPLTWFFMHMYIVCYKRLCLRLL